MKPPLPPQTRQQNYRDLFSIPADPSQGRLGVTGHQSLGRAFPEVWSWQKQEPQRQVPVAHMANPDGVPRDAGSLRVAGIHPPTLGQWWGGWQWTGKGNVGQMVL